MKERLIFILLILFISFVNALEFGISPPSIEIKMENHETRYVNYSLYSDKLINVLISDYWKNENGKEGDIFLESYDDSNENLRIEYEEKVGISKNRTFEICVWSKYEGMFDGAVVFQPEKRNIELISWIKIKVGDVSYVNADKEKEENKIILTGNTIKEENKEKNEDLNWIFLILISDISLVILIFLLLFIGRRKNRENYN